MDVPESYSIVKNSDVAFLRLLPILSNFNCSYCVMSSPDVAGMTTRAPRLARTHTVSASAADARRGAGDDGGERGEVRVRGRLQHGREEGMEEGESRLDRR